MSLDRNFVLDCSANPQEKKQPMYHCQDDTIPVDNIRRPGAFLWSAVADFMIRSVLTS